MKIILSVLLDSTDPLKLAIGLEFSSPLKPLLYALDPRVNAVDCSERKTQEEGRKRSLGPQGRVIALLSSGRRTGMTCQVFL